MGLFDPAWLKKMPSSPRPSDSQIKALETARKDFNVPHELFVGYVMQSPGYTKLLFEDQFREFQKQNPRSTMQQILEMIYQYRMFTNAIVQFNSPSVARSYIQEKHIQSLIKSVVKDMKSVDELARYVVTEEEFWETTPDPLGLNTRVAEILGYRKL